jgi:hypothetical protein
MSTVYVSLDTDENPPVTCRPESVDVDPGNEMINWVLGENQTFTFFNLSFAGNPSCMQGLCVEADSISVTDENDTGGVYPYTVVVTLNGVQYSSAKSRIGGGGGAPSIHNK